ncbi:C-4 sterol methyl oxidase, partial [Coemansia spiralis]
MERLDVFLASAREMLSSTVDVSQRIPAGYTPNWFEQVWLSMFDGRNELLAFTAIAFLMHELVYFGRYLPFLVCDYIPWMRTYKIQEAKEVTGEMKWKCIKKLMFSHFIIEGPLMLGFLPVAKLAGIRTSE